MKGSTTRSLYRYPNSDTCICSFSRTILSATTSLEISWKCLAFLYKTFWKLLLKTMRAICNHIRKRREQRRWGRRRRVCSSMYVYICMWNRVCILWHWISCASISWRMCVYVCICMRLCVCMCLCMYICMYVCMHACTNYVCMYVCMYVRVCMHVCMWV